jgi:DNA-binding transcriptional ArsR family regulator
MGDAMPAAKLTHDARSEILRLREDRGWGLERLARRFLVSRGTIEYHLLRAGVVPPQGARIPTKPLRPYVRAGKIVRPFDPVEDAKLLDLSRRGATPRLIGDVLGRGRQTITARLMALARREALREFRDANGGRRAA